MTNPHLSLRNFFIFNVDYGQEEGEEDQKIMYYFPRGTNIDLQIKDIGLSEAIIKFSKTFSDDPCEALQTLKMRRMFYQPEENFWMVLTINVPMRPKGKDVLEGIEYLGYEVQNMVFSAVLKQTYNMAKLFIGPFTSVIKSQKGDTSLLKRKLEHFFNKYIPTLRLQNCDILDVFQGVQFLPLDKATFLHAQSFVNFVESTFQQIDYSVFLFNEQLIWSGLPPEDVQVVYKYITSSLLPSYRENDLLTSLSQPRNADCGRFVTGPTNIDEINFTGKVPKVFLNSVVEPGFYHVVIYQLLGATLCLFIKSKEELAMEFYRSLDQTVSKRLLEVCKKLSDYKWSSESGASEGSQESSDTRWVYFNSMNLASKSTIHDPPANKRASSELPVTREVLRILVDIHSHNLRLAKSGCQSGETIIRTLTNRWIVGKMSNCREFYVTINKKKANLIEVNEEVKKICDKQLKSIFFHV